MPGNEFYTVRGYELLKQEKKLLTPSMEDYLEMIYRYTLEEGSIRINTLADLLNVQAPSASKTVKRLYELGLVEYKGYGVVGLTEAGLDIGKFLFQRHNIIYEFLGHLGVEENILMDTEMIEHNISMETLRLIEIFNEFCRRYPGVKEEFVEFCKERQCLS